jgi:preprotein translocase subunit YajC
MAQLCHAVHGGTMLINPAFAQGTGAPMGGIGIENLILIALMFGALYFLMIRPQMKRAKEHKTMVEALQKGDEVIAAGGILGRISRISENYVTLQVAENVEVQVQRPAIQLVLPKGTIKNIQ